ncbi:hypothetical protein P280DRAFT_518805 [Massarina eburnea CBS 473.64]|uniref:Uncharacterized protein n=1 Tax=Massarina eburnea CBS 473.64 TaxID=1395130 RepID=A0A6A6RZM2_9PLEO|nr:hypothetical protein P280DRAFT_518805 [Massarina eburnea CBS 473.64]
MDYPTFSNNSPQPSFAGYSPAPPQQHDPQARLGLQLPYGQQFTNNGQASGFPSSGMSGAALSGATAGGTMPPLSQSQLRGNPLLQQPSSPSPYSNAPFAHNLSSSPAHPQFAHQRQSSAHNSVPPYRSPSVPSNNQPNMAATTPVKSEMQSTPVKSEMQSPVSPATQAREQERIDTLLSINQLLIQEVDELHTQGKTGHIGPTVPDGDKQQQSSLEYRDCMRRLQANLAFLAQSAERHSKPSQSMMPGPAIMNAPATPDELVKLYLKLQMLFPGWRGAQAKASPGPQRLNSTSSQSSMPGMPTNMQPPNSAGLQNSMGMQPPNSAGLPPNMQLPSNAGAMNMNMMGNMQHMQ